MHTWCQYEFHSIRNELKYEVHILECISLVCYCLHSIKCERKMFIEIYRIKPSTSTHTHPNKIDIPSNNLSCMLILQNTETATIKCFAGCAAIFMLWILFRWEKFISHITILKLDVIWLVTEVYKYSHWNWFKWMYLTSVVNMEQIHFNRSNIAY